MGKLPKTRTYNKLEITDSC